MLHATSIDITNMPDLVRLVEEVRAANQPRELMLRGKIIALLVPVTNSEPQHNKTAPKAGKRTASRRA